MKTPFSPLYLAPLLLAGSIASAYAADLPPCGAANYDATRDLFTPNRSNTADGIEHPIKSQLLNQQCLLTVVPRAQAARLRPAPDGRKGPGPNGADELVEGRYVVYLSNGGAGGAGGTQREDGGGGGGAGAIQLRQEITLVPGTYKLTLGAGGPGGIACLDDLGGGPGWAGAPTSISRLDNGRTVAGTAGAAAWVRPSRYANDKSAGILDGHGGSGSGMSAGGNGGRTVSPDLEIGAKPGVAGPTGLAGQAGGGEEPGKLAPSISGGGGGGAGLGDGGNGGGESGSKFIDVVPQVGGLGAGGGGGEGRANMCSAGAPGGNGYIALHRM